MSKQVIVMRRDLNMPIGKACAQAAHSAMGPFFNMMKQSYKIKLEDFPKSNLNVVNIWGPLFHPPREKLIFFCFNDINDFLIFKLKYPNQYWGENHFYIRREN